MTTITITVNGSSYSYEASAGDVAGLGIARSGVMSKLSPGEGQTEDTPLAERPGFIADDTAWLESVVQNWATRENAEATAIQECLARCLTSWSTDDPPVQPPAEPLSPEAETARRIAGIKKEAQRRIIALTGVNDLMLCIIKQSNANMRANELNDIRISGGTLTPEQEAEAVALRNFAAAIKAIRAKSDVLELNPPEDWTDDTHWQ